MSPIELGTCIRCGGADAIEILEENDGLCFICSGGLDEDLEGIEDENL